MSCFKVRLGHKIYLRVSFSLSLLFFINIIILSFYIPTHLFFWQSNWGFKYARQGLYYVFSTLTFNLFLVVLPFENFILVHNSSILSLLLWHFTLQFSIYIYSLVANRFSIYKEQRLIIFTYGTSKSLVKSSHIYNLNIIQWLE